MFEAEEKLKIIYEIMLVKFEAQFIYHSKLRTKVRSKFVSLKLLVGSTRTLGKGEK